MLGEAKYKDRGQKKRRPKTEPPDPPPAKPFNEWDQKCQEIKNLKDTLEQCSELFREIALQCKHTGVRQDACEGQVLINKVLNQKTKV